METKLKKEIEKLEKAGTLIMEFYIVPTAKAKLYGVTAKNPIMVKNLMVLDKHRLKGVGTKALLYLDELVKTNDVDVVFGVIPPNADFKTLKNKKEPKVDLLKKWLQKNGYTVTNDSNVFYKNIDKN